MIIVLSVTDCPLADITQIHKPPFLQGLQNQSTIDVSHPKNLSNGNLDIKTPILSLSFLITQAIALDGKAFS